MNQQPHRSSSSRGVPAKKPAFWHRAYFVSSVGGVKLEVVKQYVQNQGTTDKPGRRPKTQAS